VPIRKNPDDLIGFDNALRYAIVEAGKNHNKTICSVLQKHCKCKVIKTIDDPESLNSGISLIDKDVSDTMKNFNLYAKIIIGYILAVEFETEQDLLMFTLKWG
jgi:hypothetical protein